MAGNSGRRRGGACAAALVLADFDTKTLPFVTLAARLRDAAEREGFEVLGG